MYLFLLGVIVVCFRNRHQYKVTFSYSYSIIFYGEGWNGDQILKRRFSFTIIKEKHSSNIFLINRAQQDIFQNHRPDISLLTKNVRKLLHPAGVDCSPFPLTFVGNPGDGKKSYPTTKHLLISPIRKIDLMKLNLSLSKVSFLLDQTAIFRQSSYAIFICSCSDFCCIMF